MFQKDSRYYYISDKKETTTDGIDITYKARRFLPEADQVPSAVAITSEGKRIDQVSYAILGNAKLYWKFADANTVFTPTELEKLGQKIRVPADGSNR
jgi:hypothetical protein